MVMLDNMSLDAITRIAQARGNDIELEVSGNVNLETIGEISASGVDFISVGKITHSVMAFDFSLKEHVSG